MRLGDAFGMALGNLWRRKLRSFLTITAVVIGAMSVIVMLILVLGAKQAFVRQLESMDALTLVTVSGEPGDEDGGLFNAHNGDSGRTLTDATVKKLRGLDNVVAAAPMSQVWVRSMRMEGSDRRIQPGITTVDPASGVFRVPVSAGRMLEPDEADAIVLGARAARILGAGRNAAALVGSEVLLGLDGASYYNDATRNPPLPPEHADKDYWERVSREIHWLPVKVVGVAASSMDGDGNYVTLGWARKLMTQRRWEHDGDKQRAMEEQRRIAQQQGRPFTEPDRRETMKIVRDDLLKREGYAAIMLRVDATENVADVAATVEKLGYGATSAQGMLDGMAKLFTILGLIAGAIGGISLLVAAIGIINTMVMAALERTREVGVMRAVGATRSAVVRMFTIEALVIGLVGGAIALGASMAIGAGANIAFNRMASQNSIPIADVISFPAWLIAGVLALTALIGLAAGIYPARRAARLDPVAALRYE